MSSTFSGNKTYRKLDDVSWGQWVPQITATLMFVVHNGQILLIRKKRGLGAGKINGPGGKLDPHETPLEAAIRETSEEVRIRPVDIEYAGELSFQFVDGLSLHVHVFRAHGYEGVPEETVEAIPMWFPLDALPFEQMWEDDRLWLPVMLAGRRFKGRMLFDGDRMIGHELEVVDALP